MITDSTKRTGWGVMVISGFTAGTDTSATIKIRNVSIGIPQKELAEYVKQALNRFHESQPAAGNSPDVISGQ